MSTCAECGHPLTWSPSEYWCSDACQMAWSSKGTTTGIVVPPGEPRTIPPDTWATTAIPHPSGGVTYPRSPEEYQRWVEDTAPAEPPADPKPPRWRRLLGTKGSS